jgi:hypothetical protein
LIWIAPGSAQTSAPVPSGCATGIVTLPAGINGNIKICGPVAAQAPDVARQLSQIQSAMSGQQAELDQLIRLVKNINAVGGPLGTKRQAELLLNVVTRLGDSSAVTGTQLQQRASTLSGHFEEVSTQIDAAQADPAGALKIKAALQGSTGDAIARLDFDTVENQLSDIQATVHSIDQRTQQMQGAVNDIQSDTHATAQFVQQYQQMQQSSMAQVQKMQQDLLNNPRFFISLNIVRVSGTVGGPAAIQFMAMHSADGTLTDTKMQFVFSAPGQQPWTVDADVPKFADHSTLMSGMQTLNVPKLGDRAVVCYSAMDSRVNQRRQWREAFHIVSQPSPYASLYASNPAMAQYARTSPQLAAAMNPLTFQPDSEATLTPDTGAPCPAPDPREDIQQSTQAQKDTHEQQQSQDQFQHRQEQQMTEALVHQEQTNPDLFVMINFLARGIAGGPGTLIIGATRIRHQASLTESKMQIAFTLGKLQRWVVNVPIAPLTDTSASSTRIDPPRIGDHAVLCFSAVDPTDGKRRLWRKEYVLMGQSPNEDGRFQPASDSTLALDSGAACH